MKRTPFKYGFTLIELLVVISIIAILASLAIPAVTSALIKGQMVQTLNNARQLHLSTQTMALDTLNSGSGPDWTYLNDSPMSVQAFSDQLLSNNYLTADALRKIYAAPGKLPQSGNFTAQTIAFKIMQTKESTPSDQPFVVTANWGSIQSGLTTNDPYQKKGFVVFKKGGDGGMFTRPTDATSTNVMSTNSMSPLN